MGRAIESPKRTTSSACCTSAGSSSTACSALRDAPLVRSSPCQAVDEVEQDGALLLRRGKVADPARFPHAGGYPGLWRQLRQQLHAAQPGAVLVDHAQLKNIAADHAPHARQDGGGARQA